MAYATVRLERERLTRDGGAEVAIATLDRPEKRNAITAATIEELLAVLDEVESSGARVCIVTGAGRAFCAGMDLEALQAVSSQSREQNLLDSRRIGRLFRRLYGFPVPLIAAVNGPAIAGGCAIATLCDVTLAVPEATFGYPEVRIGFLPALVSVFLIRQIGEKRARDLLVTGRIVDAGEARQLGLVTEIVPGERLLARARELASALIACSPTSLARTKRLLGRFFEAELDRDLEIAVQENAAVRSTADFREGVAAFLEKRKPVWRAE
jgi:methylglutaconyl-CoA hydratase